MSETFWRHIHGGTTHFPIVLLLTSVVCDCAAWRTRDEGLRRGLYAVGTASAAVGVLGGIGSVVAGLFMTQGRILGGGAERVHHLLVWPAMVSSVALVIWRRVSRSQVSDQGFRTYLVGMCLTTGLMLGAGFSGGQLLLGAELDQQISPTFRNQQPSPSSTPAQIAAGRELFLKNCAHCHGADAHGDEGPDLYNLDWTDSQIAARIWNGKKGQMTAFAGKMSSQNVSEIIVYLRSLK